MVRTRDGSFRAQLRLDPGVYHYKFVADGARMHDPNHPAERNGFGTPDNVVNVEARATG